MTLLDHLDISSEERQLIGEATSNSPHAFLAPLDKGLSGASVWQLKWELPHSKALSALHVFKIGATAKIEREYGATKDVACAIDANVAMPLFVRGTTRSLLRQPFSGRDPRVVMSLRQYIQGASCADAVSMIHRLYRERLAPWHCSPDLVRFEVECDLRSALDWWVSRADINASAAIAGERALGWFTRDRYGVSIVDIGRGLESMLGLVETFSIGPVHGDLHSQNVLIANGVDIHLIDFGWTAERWRAIDFLMMECSLKYMAAPPRAALDDLLEMDDMIEDATDDFADDGRWDERILYGSSLTKLGRCVMEVRKAALDIEAAHDIGQYRRGLAALTYGLTSVPRGINHPHMVATLARMHARGDLTG